MYRSKLFFGPDLIIETFRNIYLFHTLWTFVMEKNDNKEFRFESIWRARFFKFNFFPSLYNELKSICQITTKKNHRVNGVPLDGFWHAIEIFRDEVGMQLLGSRYIHLNENVKQFCHFENKKISFLAQQMCKTIYYFYCNVLKDKYFKKKKHVCLCLVWLIFTYHENRHKEYNERKGK